MRYSVRMQMPGDLEKTWGVNLYGQAQLSSAQQRKVKNTEATQAQQMQLYRPEHMFSNTTDDICYRPLYNACAEGNWDAAQAIAGSDPKFWNTRIDTMGSTPLCVAAISGQTSFIEKLVEKMTDQDLQLKDDLGYTALHNIATNGNTEAAKILVSKNRSLTGIQNYEGETPLLRAAIFGHEELLRYLKKETSDDDPDTSPFRGANGATLLITVIDADLYDVALDLVNKHPDIATTASTREPVVETETRCQQRRFAIHALATKSWPSNISQAQDHFWLRYVNSMLVKRDGMFAKALKQLGLKQLVSSIKASRANNIRYKQYLDLIEHICEVAILPDVNNISNILDEIVLEASKHGNIDFIKSIIKVDHRQIMAENKTSPSMLHNAIKYRQKEVFYYLKDSGFKDELALRRDETSQETILHLAAKLSPPDKLKEISGAALQVQHELRWYKEVEKIVQPFYRHKKDGKDNEGKSPREMFTEEHKHLIEKGEKWMKNMAKSSMLVGTLIATVVFAAAFTVPGGNDQNFDPDGNNQELGHPIFLSKRAYMVFAVSNAFAFFSSLTSVLMFLAILTARYAEEDFLKSLPQRLIIGLVMLFFAIATMTVSFIATYFLMLGYKCAWIFTLLTVLVCVPVILFARVQFHLFFRMLKSTYRSTL